jgi:hypothetical protein
MKLAMSLSFRATANKEEVTQRPQTLWIEIPEKAGGFFTGFIVPFGVVVYQLTHHFGQRRVEQWDHDEKQMAAALHTLFTSHATSSPNKDDSKSVPAEDAHEFTADELNVPTVEDTHELGA